MSKVVVLGVDPGFASFGYSVVALDDGETILEVGVITTEKSQKKANTLASDDNTVRARIITKKLVEIIDKHRPVAITAESFSFPRNASVSAKIGISWGIVDALSAIYNLSVFQASPQHIKKVVVGSKKASKEDIISTLRLRYPGSFDLFDKSYKASLHEHGYDSVGSVIACREHEGLVMALKVGGAL